MNNKIILFIITIFFSVNVYAEFTATRIFNPSNNIKAGSEFDLTYKVTNAPNYDYAIIIEDAISGAGGCTTIDGKTEVRIPFIPGASSELISSSVYKIKAPASGACVFQGVVTFTGGGGEPAQSNLQQQQVEILTCTTQSSNKCVNNKLYWYDSCGNQEGVADDCSNKGCINDALECKECTPRSSQKCDNNIIYWYDSCKVKGEKVIDCADGCINGQPSCKEQCMPRAVKKCYNNAIYWYDSCNVKEDWLENCENGCSNGANECIVCSPRSTKKCYNNALYWYDSCGNIGEKDTDCPCENGARKCIKTDEDKCNNNYKNLDEADIDCGRVCPLQCGRNSRCNDDVDCKGDLLCIGEVCKINENNKVSTNTNLDKNDLDGDGIPNVWEEKYGLNINDPKDAAEDSDKDQLTNYQEYNYSITYPMLNPLKLDTDDDEYDDRKEIFDGKDPTDPNSKPGFNLSLIFILSSVGLLIIASIFGLKKFSGKNKGIQGNRDAIRQPINKQTYQNQTIYQQQYRPQFQNQQSNISNPQEQIYNQQSYQR